MGQAQADLSTAISKFSQLSTFSSVLGSNPNLVSSLIPSNINRGVTLLIPSNDAFDKYSNSTNGGGNITAMEPSALIVILRYHVMAAPLTSANFTADQGNIVPTLLTDATHNNRSAGAALVNTYGAEAALGQVLYVSKSPSSAGKFRVKRQQAKTLQLAGGDAQGALMDAVDAQWSGGYFQIVDE